jgi:hypothetical protein
MLSLSAGHDVRIAEPPDPPPFGRSHFALVNTAHTLAGQGGGAAEHLADGPGAPKAESRARPAQVEARRAST